MAKLEHFTKITAFRLPGYLQSRMILVKNVQLI